MRLLLTSDLHYKLRQYDWLLAKAATFDAVVLVTTLGEIPDQDAAWGEIARVLKPAGRAINGELFGDPHWVSPATAEGRAGAAGLGRHRRLGPKGGYFGRHERT